MGVTVIESVGTSMLLWRDPPFVWPDAVLAASNRGHCKASGNRHRPQENQYFILVTETTPIWSAPQPLLPMVPSPT